MFQGDFLQGSMGRLALSRSVQQASPCCFNLKECFCCRDVVHGSPAQPSACCGGPGVRAEVPRNPGIRVHTLCPSPGTAVLAGGAASWSVLSPDQAVDALADGDT